MLSFSIDLLSIWMSALKIFWSQVQVLVGPPEKQTLISNDEGFVF